MKLSINPIMSIAQAALALAESERSNVFLDSGSCLHSLDTSSECAICVKACPVDAIAYDGNGGKRVVTHDGDSCVKCGLCLRVCPVEAFTGDNGVATLLAFVARQEKRAIVELGCALNPNKEQGPPQSNVVANTGACLAALGPSAILALMALGVAHLILRVDVCRNCPLAKSLVEIERTVDQVESLLQIDNSYGSPVTLLNTTNSDWPKRLVASVKAPPRSRRDFFRSLTTPDEVSQIARQLMLVDMPEDCRHPPSERTRLLLALESVSNELIGSQPLKRFQSSMLEANDSCTACGVCHRVCPTGALQFIVDDADRFQLTFDAGACTDCGICTSLCEPRALQKAALPTLQDWLAEEPFMLRYGVLRQCRKCGAGFDNRTDSDLCEICDYRHHNPFGSRLPRGFRRQNESP
jgi:ferredoxin